MEKWFEEKLEVHAGRILKLKYSEVLDEVDSEYQNIKVINTDAFGKALIHDNVIMLTEFDEAHYHEMIAHVPLSVLKAPEKVLVIGGGDGGTVREVLKHGSIKKVILCEIDETVIDISKKHFPDLSSSFKDKRVEIHCEDGAEFIKHFSDEFDLIIVDSSDPVGPAEVLFQEAFYRDMHKALKENGIIVTQSESMLYHRDIIGRLANFNKKIFPVYRYYYTLVPTYPSGMIGFSLCSKKHDPVKDLNPETEKNLADLKYYTSEIHRAAFVLPRSFKYFLEKQ